MSLKDRISSPLEAGASILDAAHLPPCLDAALDYASRRLARKGLSATLVVVRRECEMPLEDVPATTPGIRCATPEPSPAPATATMSSRSRFASTIKQLVRSGTHPVLSLSSPPERAADLQRCKTVSPTFSVSSSLDGSVASSAASSARSPRWPLSPMSPMSPASMPMTPATPATTVSYSTASSSYSTDGGAAPQTPNPFGIRLVHAAPLPPRQDKILRQTIEKAERKFRIGTEWLSPAVPPSSCGLTADLARRSVAQNEVLFASEGLTLVSLDRLYTFRRALAAYAETPSMLLLEDAVDELRRCVLAGGGRKLPRSRLLRSYCHLAFTDAALSDVCRVYRRAYGGPERECGIECDGLSASPVLVEPAIAGVGSGGAVAPGGSLEGLEPGLGISQPERQGTAIEIEPAVQRLSSPPAEETEEIQEKVQGEAEVPKEPETDLNPQPPTGTLTTSSPFSTSSPTTPRTSPGPASTLKGPALKLQTTFSPRKRKTPVPAVASTMHTRLADNDIPLALVDAASEDPAGNGDICIPIQLEPDTSREEQERDEEEEEEEQLTARPLPHPTTTTRGGRSRITASSSLPPWSSALNLNIDEVLLYHDEDDSYASPFSFSPSHLAPMTPLDVVEGAPATPNGYDDISPITRGEWGFLIGSQAGRQVGVTTF